MTSHLFFDIGDLKRCGSNVIIGKTVRIRYPELIEIGDNVIIDDFTYISTELIIDSNCHISAGCKIIGGRNATVSFGRFSTLAPNVVLAAGSDDYSAGIATPMVPKKYKGDVEIGAITLGQHCIIGANSTVLPNVVFGDGACLGAQSLAKKSLDAWSLYGGVPAKFIKNRNKTKILELTESFDSENRDV